MAARLQPDRQLAVLLGGPVQQSRGPWRQVDARNAAAILQEDDQYRLILGRNKGLEA